MIKKILFNISITLPIAFSSINAQDADPIEAARQAKLAAEKAAADAEAASGAAIEAAAAKAAAEAREKVIADREAEKARKLAEKEAFWLYLHGRGSSCHNLLLLSCMASPLFHHGRRS